MEYESLEIVSKKLCGISKYRFIENLKIFKIVSAHNLRKFEV